ncbi:aminodeoxychorismate lyase [Ectothiorhodospira variabilis]|uniref:aminodeoxychorismate lyase n=1 Tax=Ectothiorhodospira variabilis TaxID=505694 RepID=UPI001EFA2DF3|nr:aminodeoxychorismate lyase [Ectothiorhodospira variabilis]MCG5494692.1 aminodeoxychorismate lyase [Ectothiorhodospira variabilis]MCG5505086.1 aminodeoxychorismate lyase [Ectothiorhodospira variabilis]MCG5508243.1 aminodeoxychorismate lyase [Ectothiorhodospira variabilis]
MMLVNGQPSRSLPATDRGLHYGDGLFETLRVEAGEPRRWSLHLSRLRTGCDRLGIPMPDPQVLLDEARTVIHGTPLGVLKITVTRGSGPRGYRPPLHPEPTRILAFDSRARNASTDRHEGVDVRLCSMRLSRNPVLAGIKHLNRLEQVMARSEWSDEYHEGLMLDTSGQVVEGTMSNLFLVRGDALVTPDLSHCGVAGITRARVLEMARAWGLSCREEQVGLEDLWQADGLFLTNTLIGLWPVRSLEGRAMPMPPLIGRLQQAL